jgi:hypothetical protein
METDWAWTGAAMAAVALTEASATSADLNIFILLNWVEP